MIHGRFATWTFRYHLRRFATWTLRYWTVYFLDVSPPGRFEPLVVSMPGRLATSLDVSPTVCNLRYCKNLFVVRWGGGDTSRDVTKRPGIKTSNSAKRPRGETSRQRNVLQVAKRTGCESSKVVAKRPGGELAK